MKKLLPPLFVIFGFSVKASPVVWKGDTDVLSIGTQIEILEDAEGKLNIDEVSAPAMAGKFQPSKREVLSFDFSGAVRWLKFSLDNRTGDSLLLNLEQAILPAADLYFKEADGNWRCYKSGYEVPMDKKPVRNHYQIFPLPRGNKEYYIRMVSFSPPVKVRLENVNYYLLKIPDNNIFYGFYAGILIGVIIYNLFWFFSLRKFHFLHYASVVLMYFIISGSVMDGYILYFFPDADLTAFYRSLPGIAMANSSLYALLFLEIKKYVPRMHKVSLAVIFYFIAYMGWHLLLPLHQALLLNQINAVLVLGFIFLMALAAGYNKNRVGYYFALAYFIYLLIVIVEIIYIQAGKPQYIYGISHVNIAILIESVLLTFLLSKRFAWQQEEIVSARERAQNMLLEKTRENEQMARDQNIRLAHVVKERTKELAAKNETLEKTISEREALLEEKETLMYEAHHRIKNELNNIASMLMLQSRSLDDERAKKAIADSLSRVKTVSLIHENLYGSGDLEKVKFNSFIRSLIQQIQSMFPENSNRISISWNCPEIHISVNKANILGLIINELLTNSYKYAFNKADEGKINIQLQSVAPVGQDKPGEINKFKLSYWDSGPGLRSPMDVEQSSTFGMRIIKGMSRQIPAEITYSNDSGSEFAFTFSAESLEAV